ncbi:MAG: hypothetical protein IJW62_00285 [Clostridia bacterium]|nr:hypothetical protein [Clostridia bacterium]
MKRILLGLLVGGVLLLFGCGRDEPTATDLLALLLGETDMPAAEIYFGGAMADETGYLSEEIAELLYCGHSPTGLADDYAVALCKDDRSVEIHLYHALDAQAADAIEARLQIRKTLLANRDQYLYDPDSIAPGAVIWRKGKWVCLLVTPDNEAARASLNDNL